MERRAAGVPFADLKPAVDALSVGYREGRGTAAVRLPDSLRVAAYLLTRTPATYAAVEDVLRELPFAPASILDVGAGTGTAALAAREVFPQLGRITLIEADPALAGAGRELLPDAEWLVQDFRRVDPLPEHDLVFASYALAEHWDARNAMSLWRAARQALVIIEPGTPQHFEFVREARRQLLAAGAHMIAPCPGAAECPLAGPDWCHFAVRVERSSLHRRLKNASLGYEDEKFSYIALGKTPGHTPPGRILRHPQHRPGLITIQVCRGERTETVRISKKDREGFRAARNASWGDRWER
jgi:ribosomal protein RSM22 (predicted rRNA methylase)